MLTVRQIFDNMMLLLGCENPDTSPQTVRDEVLAGIQAELQKMQMAGEDFYCRETATQALTAGTSVYVLAADIQKVLNPVKISGAPLHALDSREQLDDFGPLFLGQTSRTVTSGTPIAYLVESLREISGNDNVRIRLHVVPTPNASPTLSFDCIKEAPLYDAADLCNDAVPPVPHQYHESILLPLCRKHVTTLPYFRRNAALLPQIEDAYQTALVLLGLADPREKKPRTSEVSPELKGARQ